jgi:hypothetical protein
MIIGTAVPNELNQDGGVASFGADDPMSGCLALTTSMENQARR